MGHDTENLVGEHDLDFTGIVLSPVNRNPSEMVNKIKTFRDKGNYDIILDSQLYFPSCTRRKLKDFPYFPKDLETSDTSSISWWHNIIKKLFNYAKNLDINAITSPIIMPKYFTENYYDLSVEIANNLYSLSSNSDKRIYQTAIIDFTLLNKPEYVLRLTSILSKSECKSFYLIFISDNPPRNEICDDADLLGAMNLIKEFKTIGKKVFIAFCSSDMVLFKTAGADNCSTGKFFNLRRFTKSRFEEPTGGGGQLPYWFEEGLFAFLREADLLRIRNKKIDDLIEVGFSKNYWSDKILEQFSNQPQKAWLSLAWRQYLSWFWQMEEKITQGIDIAEIEGILFQADKNWSKLDENKIFLEERKNNGEWIRAWLQALANFQG